MQIYSLRMIAMDGIPGSSESPSRLPIEVVIDHIAGDDDPLASLIAAALRACSLTCKAFLHASRYHLFHYICTDARGAERFFLII
jgi:hypothetical protein